MNKANILGVCVDIVELEDVLDMIREVVSTSQCALITHTHIRGLHIAYEQEWFRDFLNSSDLIYCDGMGVKWGASLLGYHIPQCFPFADWIWQLAELAENHDFSLFFLGNPPGAAKRAADRFRGHFPKLRIVGTHHGFFNKSIGHPENEIVVQQINDTRPNILLVGFGMPSQEMWLKENWQRLDVNIAITCGALFEYAAKDLKRGPKWMVENYLEWLARIYISPDRYGKRYLRDNPLFLYRILKQKITCSLFPKSLG